MSAHSSDICGINVTELYLNDPGNNQEPAGYVLCSDMGNTCIKNTCSCRRAAHAEVDGSTKYFGVCIILQQGKECVASGDEYLTCAVSSGTNMLNENSVATSNPSTNTKAITESNTKPLTSESSSPDDVMATEARTAASSATLSTTITVVIIVVAVVFVALLSWVVRSFCKRRSSKDSKFASRRNRNGPNTSADATSPTYITGTSSTTPPFPAFDRRAREIQSPTSKSRGGRGGRGAPSVHDSSSGRDRRNQDIDAYLAQGGSRDVTRDSRNQRNPEIDAPFLPLGPRREPTSGRGRRNPETDSSVTPLGRREPTSGQGRQNSGYDADGFRSFKEPALQREPTSGRGQADAMRSQPRDQRNKQNQPSRPVEKIATEPSGGTVYTGRNTYDRVAQFAQLAAFEAPPPLPPRPQKPIQPVPMANLVSKNTRAPQPARPARTVPKRSAFHVPDNPSPTYHDILSPKTARSLAPSIASQATTVVAAGRNRPTPLQQNRRPPYTNAPSSYYQPGLTHQNNTNAESHGLSLNDSNYDESDYGNSRYNESNYRGKYKGQTNYDDSFVSEVSSMAWSEASGLSEDSYYRAVPTSTARIPVIEPTHDDDDAHSADGYSDWSHSSDAFRSTAASDMSLFSVNSDFNDSTSDFKEREF